MFRRWIFPWVTLFPRLSSRFRRIKLLESAYNRLLNKKRWKDIENGPEVHLLATSLTTTEAGKSLCSFSKHGFYPHPDCDDGLLGEANNLPIAAGVASSSAFPPGFGPYVLKGADFGRRKIGTQRLTDGGVYDNLGLEMAQELIKKDEHSQHLLIVSNAGRSVEDDKTSSFRWLVSRSLRVTDILMQRVLDQSLTAFEKERRAVVEIQRLANRLAVTEGNSISTSDDKGHCVNGGDTNDGDPSPTLRPTSERSARTESSWKPIIIDISSDSVKDARLPEIAQNHLRAVRTDFDSFNECEIGGLVAMGYLFAQRSVEGSVKINPEVKYPWDSVLSSPLELEKVEVNVSKSYRRQLFKSLWSWRDKQGSLLVWVPTLVWAFALAGTFNHFFRAGLPVSPIPLQGRSIVLPLEEWLSSRPVLLEGITSAFEKDMYSYRYDTEKLGTHIAGSPTNLNFLSLRSHGSFRFSIVKVPEILKRERNEDSNSVIFAFLQRTTGDTTEVVPLERKDESFVVPKGYGTDTVSLILLSKSAPGPLLELAPELELEPK